MVCAGGVCGGIRPHPGSRGAGNETGEPERSGDGRKRLVGLEVVPLAAFAGLGLLARLQEPCGIRATSTSTTYEMVH